jgi:hypothetical protein
LVARLGEFVIEQRAEPFGDKVSGENRLALNYQPVFARIAAWLPLKQSLNCLYGTSYVAHGAAKAPPVEPKG